MEVATVYRCVGLQVVITDPVHVESNQPDKRAIVT